MSHPPFYRRGNRGSEVVTCQGHTAHIGQDWAGPSDPRPNTCPLSHAITSSRTELPDTISRHCQVNTIRNKIAPGTGIPGCEHLRVSLLLWDPVLLRSRDPNVLPVSAKLRSSLNFREGADEAGSPPRLFKESFRFLWPQDHW